MMILHSKSMSWDSIHSGYIGHNMISLYSGSVPAIPFTVDIIVVA
jgi:hypothetical protein